MSVEIINILLSSSWINPTWTTIRTPPYEEHRRKQQIKWQS